MPSINSPFLVKLEKDFKQRMQELQSAVDETAFLEGMLKTLGPETKAKPKAKAKRAKTKRAKPTPKPDVVTWDTVVQWFKDNYGPTDQYRTRELQEQFDKPQPWAHRRTQKLCEAGLLERYGNGLYRRPAIYTGEQARVHVGNGVLA